jgi:hypothetical protein
MIRFAALVSAGLLMVAGVAGAQTPAQPPMPSTAELYTLCAFYPQAAPCGALYRQSLRETTPPAQAVKQAFEGYARYLTPADSPGLTGQDRQYLTANGVQIPADLNAANQAGLHNVIGDPALQADAQARLRAVNNFIGRARQAELYCHFNACPRMHDGLQGT